jgi:hypothetical protein
MPDKPAGMSWESFAEASVRKAMAEGEFSNLRGAGKPIEGIDGPYREDWWLQALLKREDLSLPCDALEIRADIERTLGRVMRFSGESAVRQEVEHLNARIAKVNRTTTSGPATSACVLDPEPIVERWRARRALLPPAPVDHRR